MKALLVTILTLAAAPLGVAGMSAWLKHGNPWALIVFILCLGLAWLAIYVIDLRESVDDLTSAEGEADNAETSRSRAELYALSLSPDASQGNSTPPMSPSAVGPSKKDPKPCLP